MQSAILDQYPEADIHVFAIWMPLVHGDTRSAWSPELLSDPRVSYLWDEGQISGSWFSEHVSGQQPLAWDAYFLYAADAVWGDPPAPLLDSGYPIIDNSQQLQEMLEPLLSD